MIKSLALVGFRGHTKSFTFGPQSNKLAGPNECGKSTIAEAIAFVWFGTDLGGTKNPDHLISDGAEVTEVSLVTEHIILTRKKARGKTSTIKLARQGLPPVPMTQTELTQLMKISPEAFMCCWYACYFMERLTPEKQLAVLSELSRVDRKALLQSILGSDFEIPAKIKLHNPRIDADAVASERRQLQNMIASDEGALGQLDAQIAQVTTGAEVDVESYSGRLNDVNASLDAFDFYNKALAKYGQEKMRFGDAINRTGSLKAGKLGLNMPSADDLRKNDVRIAELVKQTSVLKGRALMLQGTIKALPAAPVKPANLQVVGTDCKLCGQKISAEHVNHIMGHYEAQLLEHNKIAREVADHNGNIEGELAKLNEQLAATANECGELQKENVRNSEAASNAKKRAAEIDAELAELAKLKEPAAPTKPEGDEPALKKEQIELNTAIVMAKKNATQLEGLNVQGALLKESIAKRRQQVGYMNALETALKSLPEIETKALLETLQVPGVVVGLKDGSLYVTNEKGIPYVSLSSGRRLKIGMAFCQSFRKTAGGRAPSWIFLDNSDLIDSFMAYNNVQFFIAEVNAKLKELTVHQSI